jgi:hypothetical protein
VSKTEASSFLTPAYIKWKSQWYPVKEN